MALEVKKRYPVPHTTRPHHTLPQRTLKREQRKKSAHRFTTTLLVIAVLAIGAGIAYTWYMGQQRTALASEAAPVARSTRPILKAYKIPSDAKVGVAVQSSTSDAKPNDNASITVRTNPEAECVISVKYNNVPATDSGLVPKVADEFGVASWSWTIAGSVPTGKWPVQVDCKNKKHSAMVRAEITIKP